MTDPTHLASDALAKKLARAIFAVGEELSGDAGRRIAFKFGSALSGTEYELGGLNESALARVIREALEKP